MLTCVVVQGLAGIVGNPVLSQAIAGLATSATAQATLERVMLFDLKDKIVEPFGETAQQVFARISAMRDSLDGPQVVRSKTVCGPKRVSCDTQPTVCLVHNPQPVCKSVCQLQASLSAHLLTSYYWGVVAPHLLLLYDA